ncbi:growth-regulating factor 8-like [Rutidosis leptorrhynchoides]|uniref:growth-regulating factor 8-like n=1 Tax=Rutidosis leptorrhynchoides TaxID=125765 RepID=UPI003A9A52BD
MGKGSDACDVGLGLNTETSSCYPCKKMIFNTESYGFYGNTSQMSSGFCSKSTTDGVMGVSGRVLFTANQWQELERQTMIYKYIMASIPVPQQLLLTLSTQSNRVVGSGLRYSNGSDPEPWRCRRTDGKKWRCSKEVAPEQKYCERHAHKTRSRSRKPVEPQPQNTKQNTNTLLSASNQQTRCSEWFMKNSGIPVSLPHNEFHQSKETTSGILKRDQIYNQDLMGNHQVKPYLNTSTSDAADGTRRQDFIDAWSRIRTEDDCSLTLSMQSGGTGVEFDHESFEMAVGMLNGDRDVFKPSQPWLNQGLWVSSTPGGPLGEALCLGINSNSNANSPQNELSPHGSNSTTTTSSSCTWFH